MFRCRIVKYLLVVFLSFPSLISAKSLENVLSDLQTLSVRFVQKEGGKGHRNEVSYGSLKVKVPGKFVWSNQDDRQQDVVADGESIWIYEKDLNQVSVYKQKETLLKTPAVLISDPKQFKDNFVIDQEREGKDGVWYSLSPVEKDSYYDYIEVYVSDSLLKQLIVSNRLNDSITRIEFYYSENSVNAPIDDAVFDFDMPEGADLLY